jgi:hypothetical protein
VRARAAPARSRPPVRAAALHRARDQLGARLQAPLPALGAREAATHACTIPVYRDRYQQTKARLGKQRGAKVAEIDLARRLAEAIWHMLTREQPFAPKGATDPLAA